MPRPTTINTTVTLTEKEESLCSLLNNVATDCDSRKTNAATKNDTVVRFAGGWVRDKLLGIESGDLDVAVNNMSGYDFAQAVNAYIKKSASSIRTAKITKIVGNPEKGKNLECATVKILELDCDFVNLRKRSDEGQAETLGTASEDAHLRDLTMNALFYNIRTRAIEDWTGKGLSDLQQGFIRTPLPPIETFSDDPLRILRCVRFASKYDFQLTDEVWKAMQDVKLTTAFGSIISKERILSEVDKMMTSCPVTAINLICQLGLFTIIFPPLPGRTVNAPKIAQDRAHAFQWMMRNVGCIDKPIPQFTFEQLTVEDRRSLSYAILLSPFEGIYARESIQSAEIVMGESLKAGLADRRVTGHLFAVVNDVKELAHRHNETILGKSEGVDRKELGFLVRKIGTQPQIGKRWPIALAYSLICELARHVDVLDSTVRLDDVEHDVIRKIHPYFYLLERIQEFDLGDCWNWKSIVNGNEICKALSLKPGPQLKNVMNAVMGWQLTHPKGIQEECILWLKSLQEQSLERTADEIERTRKGEEDGPDKKRTRTEGGETLR